MALKTTINLQGDRILIRKMSSVQKSLSEAQREAGKTLGNEILSEAREIIETKAPRSSGTLSDSLDVVTNKSSGGWNTKVFIGGAAKKYGYKVESGWPQEKIKITPEFIDWARRTIGDEFADNLKPGANFTVRSGNNPRYDTRRGMRFFQIPFEKKQNRIFTRYQNKVKEALKQSGLD